MGFKLKKFFRCLRAKLNHKNINKIKKNNNRTIGRMIKKN